MSVQRPRTLYRDATPRDVASLVLALLVAGMLPGCTSEDSAVARPPARSDNRHITALGRLAPRNGILRVAGPSRPSVVIAKLLVDEGDQVQAGQPLAELDSLTTDEAGVTKARAALRNAETEPGCIRPLVIEKVASSSALDDAQPKVDTARADLAAAQAVLDLDVVRAPAAGQIVRVYARRGERVGRQGFAEIAQNARGIPGVARRWGSRSTRTSIRTSCRAGRSSGSPSRGRWPLGRRSCSPTSPPARSTGTPAARW